MNRYSVPKYRFYIKEVKMYLAYLKIDATAPKNNSINYNNNRDKISVDCAKSVFIPELNPWPIS